MEATNLNLEIDTQKLNEAIINIEKSNEKIEKIFNKINLTINYLQSENVWNGETNDALIKRFEMLQEYFPKINSGIASYTTFLHKTNENYVNALKSINNDIDSNSEELSV